MTHIGDNPHWPEIYDSHALDIIHIRRYLIHDYETGNFAEAIEEKITA